MPAKNAQPLPEWTPDQGAVSESKAQRRSYKKSSTTLPHGHVLIDGHKVYYREPSIEDVNSLTQADNAFNNETKRIQRQSQPGKAPQTGKTVKPQLDEDQAREQSVASIATRQAIYYDFLKTRLTGWELPDDDDTSLAFTPQNIEDLPFTIAFEIATKMQQASVIGVSQAGFLGDNSESG